MPPTTSANKATTQSTRPNSQIHAHITAAFFSYLVEHVDVGVLRLVHRGDDLALVLGKKESWGGVVLVDSFVGWLVGWLGAFLMVIGGWTRGSHSFIHSGDWVDRSTDQSMTEAGRSSYLGRLDAEALHDVHPDVLVHVEHPRLLAPPLQQPLSFVVVWWRGGRG